MALREIGKIVLVYLQMVTAHVGGVLDIKWPDTYNQVKPQNRIPLPPLPLV